MVNYAEEADFGNRRARKWRSPQEIAARKKERAAARSEEEWRSYAKDLCYRQLAMMERSTAQLKEAMEKNLVPGEIAQDTLDAFIDADLVNDERFAGMFVRTRFAGKTTSRRALRMELERKGITGEIADAALEQITSEDEEEAAIDFAVRKLRSMSHVAPKVQKRRLYGALGRRGFSSSQIRAAMEAAFSESR
ncbi:regulatory protein [Trueperella bonasi]|uniref:Regulatory protein RecX n=1 Tax=Trueperella bonasi TaxID=312286 RepID=A0ABT9NHW0_9ACTO|nr:regulatory protein RecX [Trueperella bonasi]MDP9806989.1 regulatory protein [Trueperella bonasi]